MNFSIFNTPFPRPEPTRKNLLWLLLIGLGCSLFIILYKPFGIENVNGQWYYNLVVLSLGLLFVGSILLVEWGIPSLFPRPFQNWTLGKALLWYSCMTLFIGAVIFLYKGYWANFNDFTFIEYFYVMGRIVIITITVSFFVWGVYQFVGSGKVSTLTNKETYMITPQNGNPIELKLKDILYINSNDNYVDIHFMSNGERKKNLIRSSLKSVEAQIVNPLSPIRRCHRGYLINVEYFKIQKMTSRNMVIALLHYPDEIPVSKQYIESIKNQLQTRH